jgi:hypothetical protein
MCHVVKLHEKSPHNCVLFKNIYNHLQFEDVALSGATIIPFSGV